MQDLPRKSLLAKVIGQIHLLVVRYRITGYLVFSVAGGLLGLWVGGFTGGCWGTTTGWCLCWHLLRAGRVPIVFFTGCVNFYYDEAFGDLDEADAFFLAPILLSILAAMFLYLVFFVSGVQPEAMQHFFKQVSHILPSYQKIDYLMRYSKISDEAGFFLKCSIPLFVLLMIFMPCIPIFWKTAEERKSIQLKMTGISPWRAYGLILLLILLSAACLFIIVYDGIALTGGYYDDRSQTVLPRVLFLAGFLGAISGVGWRRIALYAYWYYRIRIRKQA
ncbi:hypothetical protein [Ferrovibrio sp.]|uniref:hypothetical protein n=1 Tax=Ferrovibrio sp. TaxID=1917215 RepID=UPI003D14637C